ncbi:MAG: prolipoprotein diacylglyceryl transferase [Phycisphaerae bacterium]
MYPTLFRIPFLPDWLADIKAYGVMMMIAFLSGIWLACRRASRSQANPDTVLNIGFLALIFGVIGARAMFVLHYWDTRFANQPNPIAAVFDIHGGGLEFWGGPLLVIPVVILYLRYIAKTSVRWFLDITAPSLIWGLAITRIGCFLNGCCWGAVCLDQHDVNQQRAALPWAVRFPYGSNAMNQQYAFGQLTLPKELIYVFPSGESSPVFRKLIDKAVADGGKTRKRLEEAKKKAFKAYREQKTAGADPETLKRLDERRARAGEALKDYYYKTDIGLIDRHCRKFGLTPGELSVLASHYPSKPVHPSQLYAVVNGLIICWFLSALFYYRKRHGIVLGWFLILYSISRVFLELIRADNPLDTFGGITISQGISITTFLAGVLWLWIMHKKLPLYSPRAVPYVLPEEEQPARARPAS